MGRRKLFINRGHQYRGVADQGANEPGRPIRPGSNLQRREPNLQCGRLKPELRNQKTQDDHQDAVSGVFDVAHENAAKPLHRRGRDEAHQAANRNLQHAQYQRPAPKVQFQLVYILRQGDPTIRFKVKDGSAKSDNNPQSVF